MSDDILQNLLQQLQSDIFSKFEELKADNENVKMRLDKIEERLGIAKETQESKSTDEKEEVIEIPIEISENKEDDNIVDKKESAVENIQEFNMVVDDGEYEVNVKNNNTDINLNVIIKNVS